jgi:hypothetical protein
MTEAFYNASIQMSLSNGVSFLLVQPLVTRGSLADIALYLTTAVDKCHNKQRSVASALANNACAYDITGVLTVSVFMQYINLWERLRHIQLVPERPDAFTWQWEVLGLYSVALHTMPFAAAKPQSSAQRSCGKCAARGNASSSSGSPFSIVAGPLKDATTTVSKIQQTTLYAPRPQNILTICW